MSEGFWELNLMEGKNPSHTGGFLTAYDQREFSPEEVAARESGQNAMDAGKSVSGVTRLVFQKLKASGQDKKNFLDLIKANELLEPRIGVFGLEERNKWFAKSVEHFLSSDQIHALLIRDYNTCGLGGRWDRYQKGDHFAKLVCALNLDDKADGNPSSGGSFGLGKTTYAKSSNINTVIYHSVFVPTIDTDETQRRLMVAGVFPKHEFNGKNFGGFAYFGKENEKNPGIAEPLKDSEALQFWSKMSEIFSVNLERSASETGTDILIIMDSLDLKKIKLAVEDYYFPALISNELSVSFIDENNDVDSPSVLAREDLDQFVKLYKRAKGSELIKEDTLRVDSFNRRESLNIGRYAYQASEPDEASSKRNNCVAIMRGTGMVVNYVKVGGDQYEPAVGVFIADSDMQPYLQIAENAAHSEWSEHSHRLHQKFSENGRSIVSHVNSVIKRRFIEFQKELQPDISHSRSENGLFARLLTSALAGSKGDASPKKSFNNPVSIELRQKSRSDKLSVWTLKIRDCEYTPDAPFSLTLMPSISLAGDAKKVAIKHMDFLVKDRDGVLLSEGTSPKLAYNFAKGMALDFTVEIRNPGRNNYLVQCKCIAENGEFNVN